MTQKQARRKCLAILNDWREVPGLAIYPFAEKYCGTNSRSTIFRAVSTPERTGLLPYWVLVAGITLANEAMESGDHKGAARWVSRILDARATIIAALPNATKKRGKK